MTYAAGVPPGTPAGVLSTPSEVAFASEKATPPPEGAWSLCCARCSWRVRRADSSMSSNSVPLCVSSWLAVGVSPNSPKTVSMVERSAARSSCSVVTLPPAGGASL
eukprot:2440502-Amphidinium_carterae.2